MAAYVVATGFLALAIRMSRVPFKFIVRGLKAVMVILLISISFNLFLTDGQELFRLGFCGSPGRGFPCPVLWDCG